MTNLLARKLRNNATDAEKHLWYELRTLKNDGVHFRRQVAISPYIADFACYRPKLVVELDGGQHNEELNRHTDALRSRALEARGFRVLRFWDVDVFQNRDGIIDIIRHAAGLPTLYAYDEHHPLAPPTPNPSPWRGGVRGGGLSPRERCLP